MTTYVTVNTQASLQGARPGGKAVVVQTPVTPKKAPVSGLIWPA